MEQQKVEWYNNFDFLDFYAIVSARRRMHEEPRNEPEILMDELISKWNSSVVKWSKIDSTKNA